MGRVDYDSYTDDGSSAGRPLHHWNKKIFEIDFISQGVLIHGYNSYNSNRHH